MTALLKLHFYRTVENKTVITISNVWPMLKRYIYIDILHSNFECNQQSVMLFILMKPRELHNLLKVSVLFGHRHWFWGREISSKDTFKSNKNGGCSFVCPPPSKQVQPQDNVYSCNTTNVSV